MVNVLGVVVTPSLPGMAPRAILVGERLIGGERLGRFDFPIGKREVCADETVCSDLVML
jgi:hypothetical protein